MGEKGGDISTRPGGVWRFWTIGSKKLLQDSTVNRENGLGWVGLARIAFFSLFFFFLGR